MSKVDEFLSLYKNKNTIGGYRTAVNNFFNVISKNPDEYILKHQQKPDMAEIETDLKKLIDSIDGTFKTKESSMTGMKIFLEYYNIILKHSVRRRISNYFGKGDVESTESSNQSRIKNNTHSSRCNIDSIDSSCIF